MAVPRPSDVAQLRLTRVYWTYDSADGKVMYVSMTGGSPTTLASGLSHPHGIAFRVDTIYWTTADSAGTVAAMSLTDGTVTTLITGQDTPTDIVVPGSNAFWTNRSGSVMKEPITGGQRHHARLEPGLASLHRFL
jgi:hypothetical protein